MCGPPGAGQAGPVHAGSTEIELVSAAQQGGLPVAQPPPAGHAAAESQRLGEFFPGDTGAQYEDDTVQGQLVAQARSASLERRATTDSNGAIFW